MNKQIKESNGSEDKKESKEKRKIFLKSSTR